MNKSMKKGFTLIELLVVIAIIGILAATVLIGMKSARAKARDVQRKSNVKAVMNGIEMFYDDNNQAYPAIAAATTCPATLSALVGILGGTQVAGSTSPAFTNDAVSGSYNPVSGYFDALAVPSTNTKWTTTTAIPIIAGTVSQVAVGQNMEAGSGTGTVFVVKSAQ